MSQSSPAVQDKCFLATTQEQGVEGRVRQRDTHMWGIKSQERASGETQGALPILATVGAGQLMVGRGWTLTVLSVEEIISQ